MNKDRVEGKVKDMAGRVERQVGEWTDDPKKQAEGAAKQVEGKAQNAWGKVKDAAQSATKKDSAPKSSKPPQRVADSTDADETAELSRRQGK